MKPGCCPRSLGRSAPWTDEALVEGEDDRAGPIAQLELVEYVTAVGLYRALGDEQLVRDLVVRQPTPHESKDIQLPARERAQGLRCIRRRRHSTVGGEDAACDGRIEIGAARRDYPNSAGDLLAGRVLGSIRSSRCVTRRFMASTPAHLN